VTRQVARMLLCLVLAGLGFDLLDGRAPSSPAVPQDCSAPPSARTVLVGCNLSDEQRVIFTAAVAASGHPGVVLLDSPQTSDDHASFLAAFKPDQIVAVGSLPDGIVDLERRLGASVTRLLPWSKGQPVSLWQALFKQAPTVVVCPAEPRRVLLQSACLAGVLRAPLFACRGTPGEIDRLKQLLADWRTRRVYAAGEAYDLCRNLPVDHVARLAGEKAVAACYLRHQLKRGRIDTLVIANAADTPSVAGENGMSSLAPWITLQRRAVLLLTNLWGNNVRSLVKEALRNPALNQVDAVLFMADLDTIPMEQRPNPISTGKDKFIEMEPLTPKGREPFSFATGRLFHEDPGMIPLVLARQRLMATKSLARKALVYSNVTGNLPLLETISRTTALELRNRGYDTTAVFGKDANKDDLRSLLPEHDVFLWEGHYNTLAKEYGIGKWTEPMPPMLVFLQSCLALNEFMADSLLHRGAIGLIGSSTRTYAVSGGALSLAFFDALLYENQSVGSALRHAKNFMLAYSLLKQKRLGKAAKWTGANLRSAWAFSLWGDPTLERPRPLAPDNRLPHPDATGHHPRENANRQVSHASSAERPPGGTPEQARRYGWTSTDPVRVCGGASPCWAGRSGSEVDERRAC